jgi:uncharacterized surface protein with fasciclin (FAS1) repeats
MKNNRLLKTGLVILTSVFFLSTTLTSCKNNDDVSPTISQIAVSMKGFSQLEAAAIRGGVAITLSNKNTNDPSGNFTVFAPTNEAFAKIGLVNPADLNVLQKSFLTDVLLYHVNDGLTLETSLSIRTVVNSLLGKSTGRPTGFTKRIFTRGNERFINGSKIIATNVKADNGVVHVIDRVLLASGADIANTAIFFAQGKGFVNPELSFLVEAVVYADLVGALADPSANYMVFAPTNQAFRDLGVLLGVPLNQPSDIRKLPKATVAQVLSTHVFNFNGGALFTSQLNGGNIPRALNLNNQEITLGAYTNGYLTVKARGNATPANMVIPDVQCTNGIVHVIDRVLLPQ